MIAAIVGRDTLGEIALLAGSLLILVASIGVVRFPDSITRNHALGKASTLGASVALLGVALTRSELNDVMSLLFATALQAATSPVSATLMTRAMYYAERVDIDLDRVDELADALDREG